MKNIIKRLIKEELQKLNENYLDGIWFHGTNKEFEKPNLVVGEFDNMGGFFLTKNINFAKGFAKGNNKIIKAYEVNPNANIFDFIENKNHLLQYAKQIKKETEAPTSTKFDIEYPIPTYMTVEDYASILDTTIGSNQLFNNAYKFIRKAYPNIKGSDEDIYNTVLDDYHYDKLVLIMRRKQLYKDYLSIEKNDVSIKRAGFDGAYVYEDNIKNLQIYNLDVIENIGKTNLIKESIKNNIITCDNCHWEWNIKDGGKDKYICHKCGYDNNPNLLNEKCWKGYTQKGMKTMFGKRYPNCVKLKEEEDYRSSHKAPNKNYGSPMYDLTNSFGEEIYSPKALQYYGDGFPFDNLAIQIMQGARNKPNKLIKIYRAVPKEENINSINNGDWVTTTLQYAKGHGQSVLDNNYKILSMNVPANTLYTDGSSIHEWGYNP